MRRVDDVSECKVGAMVSQRLILNRIFNVGLDQHQETRVLK